MANKITTYKKIKTARDTLKSLALEMKVAVDGLPSASYKTKGGAILSTHATSVAKIFNSAEGNLTEAHRAANALGSVKNKPKAATISYKISKCSGNSDIYISDADALSSANALGACITKLKALNSDIQVCYNEINSVNVTEQLISSLTIIDFLFPLTGMTKAAQIIYVKNVGTTNLKQAKSDVTKIISYCETLKKEVISSVNEFAKCEEKVKSRTYDDLLNTTSQITEDSKTSSKEIKEKISALEAKQKEYVALYGVESQAIAAEIARLKKLYGTDYISLKPNMGSYSMKQGDYSAFTIPYGYNAGCCATAYAIGLSITRGQPYNPTSFWWQSDGLTHYTEGGVGNYQGFNASKVYESLKSGKPTMFHYTYTTKTRSSQHWVVITGIREGADPDNLTYRDFMAIDPGTGTERSLADIADNCVTFNIQGMKIFS